MDQSHLAMLHSFSTEQYNYSRTSLFRSRSGLDQSDRKVKVTVLVELLCPVFYCYGKNLGLSQGDHNAEMAVLPM